jgi:probable selenium-dependent hydroxylase accessory protein YqeC
MRITSKTLLDPLMALEIDSSTRCLSLVGAGGKTSLMYALAKKLVHRGKTVICTTSTKIYPPDKDQPSKVFLFEDNFPALDRLAVEIKEAKSCVIGMKTDPVTTKIIGISNELIKLLLGLADHIIVEADGAAGRPIKAPLHYEPVVPDFTDLTVLVVGLDAVFAEVNEKNVFRLENFLRVTGLKLGDKISPQDIGTLIKHPDGSLRNIPTERLVRVFLNKLDTLKDSQILGELATVILKTRGDRIRSVVAGSLHAEGVGYKVFTQSA